MKSLRDDIIPILIIIVILIISVFTLKAWLKDNPSVPENKPELKDPITFQSTPQTIDDLFTLDIVDGWKLTQENLDRQVDRLIFARNGNQEAFLTISIYSQQKIASLDQLIEGRYGGALLESTENLTVNGFEAKLVKANFLNGHGVRNGADMLIKLNDDLYISLNSLHSPLGEQDWIVKAEIDFMQTSFKLLSS